MLEQFLAMVVAAHKSGVEVGVLRAQLLLQGMDEEEVSLMIDVVIIEVRQGVRANPTNKATTYTQVVTPTGQIVDVRC